MMMIIKSVRLFFLISTTYGLPERWWWIKMLLFHWEMEWLASWLPQLKECGRNGTVPVRASLAFKKTSSFCFWGTLELREYTTHIQFMGKKFNYPETAMLWGSPRGLPGEAMWKERSSQFPPIPVIPTEVLNMSVEKSSWMPISVEPSKEYSPRYHATATAWKTLMITSQLSPVNPQKHAREWGIVILS